MKTKRILATLIAVMMMVSVIPTVSFAAVQFAQNVSSTANYTGFA